MAGEALLPGKWASLGVMAGVNFNIVVAFVPTRKKRGEK